MNLLKIYKSLRIFFLPLAPAYLAVFYFLRMISRPRKAGVPVICVGNITTGGAGKTPAVIRIAEILKQEGYAPGIISRGYGGTASGSGGIVSMLSRSEAGDEMSVIASRLPGVPVAVAADRRVAAKLLKNNSDIDIILMDDGFQNNSIHKDICIVAVDALRPFGNRLPLPAGDLREPVSSLKRSDIVLLNKCDLVEESKLTILTDKINRITGNRSLFKTYYKNEYIFPAKDKTKKILPGKLKNKKVLLVSGIGNPDAFCASVKKYSPAFVRHIQLVDHYKYNEKDIIKIISISDYFDYILFTEKDYIKIMDFVLNDKCFVFMNTTSIEKEEQFTKQLVALINKI